MEKEEILEVLYNAVTKKIKPSANVKKVEGEFIEVREKFLKQVGEEYRNELEKVTDAAISICAEEEKQFFYEGYKTAEKLLKNSVS